ncbi:MAG: hypothetical protein GX448_20360 [Planctomycetes bacterium]|nr:hypothetical protein [Planctomycetota bacterium]
MGTHADILVGDAEFFLAEYGEPVIVHPPTGLDRPVTALVERSSPDLQDRPRAEIQPLIVRLRNDASAGIAAAEISGHWYVSVRRELGGEYVKLRVTRWPQQDAAFIAVELT